MSRGFRRPERLRTPPYPTNPTERDQLQQRDAARRLVEAVRPYAGVPPATVARLVGCSVGDVKAARRTLKVDERTGRPL